MLSLAILAIALGLIMLAFGSRLALLGAGVGALLGIGFLRLLPGSQDNWLWLIIPVGLAILFAVGAGIAKGMIGLVSMSMGALAGGAIVFALLDLFGLDLGFTNWILVLVGAVIVAVLASRFTRWTLIILAGVVGALLCVRGLQMVFPVMEGFIASLIGLVLAGVGIAYQGGLLGSQKSGS